MAENNNINIFQTLHGYKSGHKLLSSSIDLSDLERREMLALSDYSGSGFERGFDSYLTGYPLPSSKYYVFAKTWYADEMTRPGCVWTHSLLIDFTDLWAIKNMASLLKYFVRPEQSVEYPLYSESLKINPTEYFSEESLDDLFYKLSCSLYDSENRGLVISADLSTEYEKKILQVWNWQWPRLKRSFTFSTGSLALRTYDGRPFDIQVIPYKRLRSVLSINTEIFRIVDLQDFECENTWIEQYKSIDLNQLQQFMVKYGSDISGSKSNFIALLDSFFIIKTPGSYTVTDIEKFFKNNFSDQASAKQLKLTIIENLFKSKKKNGFQIIDLLLTEELFNGITWNYSKMILDLWKSHTISPIQVNDLLKKLNSRKLDEDVINILQVIDPTIWITFDLNKKYLQKILFTSPQLQDDSSFWISERAIQTKWFNILSENSNTDWRRVMISMLNAHFGKYAIQIFQELGSETIDSLLSWIEINDKGLAVEWIEILRNNQEQFFLSLSKIKRLNSRLINSALEILNPYDSYWKKIPSDCIEQFLLGVDNAKFQSESTAIYTFFISASYANNLGNSEYINTLVFQPLHDKLKGSIYDFDSWERFKWNMGKELYGLIEQSYLSKLFKDKNWVPDWDRCEFLRRSLIATFLKYDWNPVSLLQAVTDKSTFEKITEFGIEVHGGRKMLKKIFKLLKESKFESTFHYKILKSLLD